jgi:diguanylate cyclase (GGDEF)-like protein
MDEWARKSWIDTSDEGVMRGRKERETELETMVEEQRRRVAELELVLERQAGRDPLTGLANLGRLRDQLETEVQRARRHGRPLTVAVVDVDNFRDVNARCGYGVGDELLQTVAKMLGDATRASDVVARTGSDEFVLVLPETDTMGALNAFERLMLELEALELGAISGASVSIGVAALQNGESGMDLVAQASQALDSARRQGGARALAIDPGQVGKSDDDAGREQAISALAVALLERDRYTGEHSESVLKMVEGVAEGLGLDAKEVERIKAAALLHDIGKVAIPDDILHKPAKLNDEEWKLMREHPAIGERILRAVTGMGGVARIVRHEHESFDGSGYPDGLAGNDIPIGSRIILACDAYHAMTSDRPYRDAMAHKDAVDELLDNAGKQFDPEVVECLLGYLYGHRQSGAREPV